MEQQLQSPATQIMTPVTKLEKILTIASTNWPIIIDKTTKASTALSIFKKIETDEDDIKAMQMLAKVKTTLDVVVTLRKEFTEILDDAKDAAMIPERKISNLASNTESEYIRVKKLRDDYANKKLNEQKAETERIRKEKEANDEKVAIISRIELNVQSKAVGVVSQLKTSLVNFLGTFTLENFDVKAGQMNATPKLKEALYDSWFIVPYDMNKVTEERYDKIVLDCKSILKYDDINAVYVTDALLVIADKKKELPALKAALENAAKDPFYSNDMFASGSEDKVQKELDKIKADEEAKVAELAAQAKQKENEALLKNEFESQVAQQGVTTLSKGTKTKNIAVINIAPENIVDLFARVLHACFSNPKFFGYIKRDKKGQICKDEAGNDIYESWASDVLDFYANYCDNIKIEGITLKEVASTTQRAKK